MGVHSTSSRHVPNLPPSPCKMLISPQPTGATYFSFLHIGNVQLRSSFALNKVKRQKPSWIESILTNRNILNLTSLILPCATGCKCTEISSHFLCSRFQALCNSHNPHYANVVFLPLYFLHKFFWLCFPGYVQFHTSSEISASIKKIVQCLWNHCFRHSLSSRSCCFLPKAGRRAVLCLQFSYQWHF